MAHFRCYTCEDLFDISLVHPLDGIPFCETCKKDYDEKLKPKKPKHPLEGNPYEKDNHVKPKGVKKTEKKVKRR